MNWFTPYTIPMFLSGVIAVGLILAVLRWPLAAASGWFIGLMAGVAVWSFFYGLELADYDLARTILWSKIQYFGAVTVPVMWMALVLAYAGQQKWLESPRNVAFLFILPVVTLILVWTNEYHQLLWINPQLVLDAPFNTLTFERGLWYWVNTGYSYAIFVLSTVLLVAAYVQANRLYRQQIVVLLLFSVLVWLGNVFYILGVTPSNLNVTTVSFAVGGMVLAWGLFRYRVFNVMPVASELVVDTMSDVVMVLDPANRVLNLNPAAEEWLGCQLIDAFGQPINRFSTHWPVLAPFFQLSAPVREEVVFDAADDSYTMELQVMPIFGRDDWLTARLAILNDITERKRAEQALVEARDQALDALRVRRQLLANVSHELRSPLGAILGFAELLKDGTFGEISPKQYDVAGKIVNSTQYLSDLVNDLLYQAQIEAGGIIVKSEPFDVPEMLRRVEEKMAVLAQVKGLAFSLECAEDVPDTLLGDTLRLQQILVNLINNAIKYTETGSVAVRVFCPDAGHWAIAVTDTGPGIPQDAQSYIFEAFRQVDDGQRTTIQGVGLGLSIAKQLVSLMDGVISVESIEGQGSTFAVTLPLKPVLQETQ